MQACHGISDDEAAVAQNIFIKSHMWTSHCVAPSISMQYGMNGKKRIAIFLNFDCENTYCALTTI
tara:strand:+ start:25251 stop:25445 length:195 start_codon:yes stop_codon:yes gene_type:complete